MRRLTLTLTLVMLSSSAALAQTLDQAPDQAPDLAPDQAPDQAVELSALAPPTDVVVADVPNDEGNSLSIMWTASADAAVQSYGVFATMDIEGDEWEEVGVALAAETSLTWNGAERDAEYWIRVVALAPGAAGESQIVGPTVATAQWLRLDKTSIFLVGLTLCLFIVYFIQKARRGGEIWLRKLAGLDAIDEAIGRATEMGRPILYVPGIQDMDNVQTLAGLTILGHTARMVAEYDTKLDVPVARSLVMTAGREIIRQAFTEAGRPDAYNDDMVHYLTDEQFGYVAGVNGIIVRDQPATCIYMGAFFAESLILAETGNAAGAIQIAGTAMPSQLPFFVAACDYTLIGEELFAASAYLSHDPKQMGSLKGQDAGKAIAMVAILIGSLLATGSALTGASIFDDVLGYLRAIFS